MKKILLIIILILIILLLSSNEEDEFYEVKVYFCPEDDCENVYASNILKNENVICAFYSLSNQEVINALNNVTSKVIVHEGNGRGLMHHKFCVLNETHLFLGSANPTDNDFFNNYNNVLLIRSEIQVKRYTAEFNRLTEESYDYPSNIDLKSYFCPYNNCQEFILKELRNAEKSIKMLTFTFTDHDIARELVRKNQEKIEVKVITDNFQNKQYWTRPFLIKNNIEIRINTGNIQHNKVFIIDDNIVITGSYNPTRAAYTINNENIIIIKDERINKAYANYFQKIWDKTSI